MAMFRDYYRHLDSTAHRLPRLRLPRSRAFAGLAAILGAALLITGCALLNLRDDLREIEKLAALEGNVAETGSLDGPVVLAVIKDEFRRDHLAEVRVIDPDRFEIMLPKGTYFVFIYVDENRDFQYQPNEPAGFFGDPTPISLAEGARRTGLTISLKRNLELPENARQKEGADGAASTDLPYLWAGRRNVGALIALDDPRFDRKIASMGLWEPLRFTLDPGPGLFFLEPYSAAKKPVLFVHGIGGTPQDWRPVIAALDRTRFQPWVFTYASGLPIETNARHLIDAMRQIRLQYRVDRLSLVAHSMGGLVAQAFIDRHKPGEAAYIDLLVTICTPWQGHDAAQLGKDLSPVTAPVWLDMAPSSAFLTRLGKAGPPPDLEFHLFFGYGGRALLGQQAGDGTVTVASQLDPRAQDRATRIYGFDAGHVDILARKDVRERLNSLLEAQLN